MGKERKIDDDEEDDEEMIKIATSRLITPAGEGKQKKKSSLPPLRLGLVAILLSFGSSFNFGFQLLITNPAQGAFLQFLNDSRSLRGYDAFDEKQLENQWSLIVATFFLGSVIGAFLIRSVAENFGRRNGLIISVFVQAVSCCLAIFSYMTINHTIFQLSRLLMGLGITTAMGLSAIFITEASPTHCRGVTSLINGVFLQLSLTVGAIMAMPNLLGTVDSWYLLYCFQLILTMMVLATLPWIHESPQHLTDRLAAIEAIRFYQKVSRHQAEWIVKTMHDSNGGGVGRHRKSLMSVWKDPFLRRGTLLGMLVTWGMAMTGITVINAFAFEILLNTGLGKFEASVANVFVCMFSFAGILVSTRIIDHHGRRPLLLTTFSALAIVNVCIVGLMYAHKYTETHLVGYLLVAAICIFNFVFAMGPGPVSLFLSGELVPHMSRSASSTWSNAIMASTRFVILSIYLPVKNASSEYTAYAIFFIAPMIFAVIILYCCLPETKGKNVEEIRNAYENHHRASAGPPAGLPAGPPPLLLQKTDEEN